MNPESRGPARIGDVLKGPVLPKTFGRPTPIPQLPSIFYEILEPGMESGTVDLYSGPWIEGETIWVTDGAAVFWVSAHQLDPIVSLSKALDPTDARPKNMGARIQRAGPFEDRPMALPSVLTSPNVEPPACLYCRGDRFVYGPILDARGVASRLFCEKCKATGRRRAHGVSDWLLPATDFLPAIGIDRWYTTLIRRYQGQLYAPRLSDPRDVSPFHVVFTGPPRVFGLIMPAIDVKPSPVECRRNRAVSKLSSTRSRSKR